VAFILLQQRRSPAINGRVDSVFGGHALMLPLRCFWQLDSAKQGKRYEAHPISLKRKDPQTPVHALDQMFQTSGLPHPR